MIILDQNVKCLQNSQGMNDMPEHSTFVESMQIAQNSYQQKDFEEAAFHLAGALAQDPLNSDVLELFDLIINEAPEIENLVPVKEESYYGEQIARAYIESTQANYQQAISLLINVLSQFPDIGLEKWLPSWLADARFRNVNVDIEEINGFISDRLMHTSGRIRLRPSETDYYKRFTQVVFTLVKYFPEAIDVLVIASHILRRAEHLDDAIRLASDSLKRNSDPDSAIALALAYRATGQYNRAISSFEQAYKLEKDPSFFLEMAYTRWDAGGHKAALKYLKKALKKDESLENDTEFNCMMKYLKGEDEIHNILGPDAKPDDIKLVATPLVGYLFSAKDYSVGIYEQVSQHGLKGNSIQVTAPCIEPPSALLALAMATIGTLDLTELEYEYHETPKPDPRDSDFEPKLKAWSYDLDTGRIPIQAVKRPRTDISVLVSTIADQAYYLPHWWNQAKQLMKNNPVDLSELIGAMVYPQPAPAHFKTSTWINHQQIASALLISAAETQWHGSLRREILLDLMHGPIDWVTDSVLIALTEVALDTPDAITEIAYEFEQLAKRIPDFGHWSVCAYLPLCYKRLPGRSIRSINKLNNLLSQYTESAQSFGSI